MVEVRIDHWVAIGEPSAIIARPAALYIMPVSISRYGLLKKRLDRFTRMLHGVKNCDVRALHRMRVASRRLREVLPVLQLEARLAHELGRRLRKVTRRLGHVRELDVLLLLIDDLQKSGRYDQESLELVAAMLTEEHHEARGRLTAKMPVGELNRLASKLDKVAKAVAHDGRTEAKGRTATRGLRWAVDARLERRASALKTAIERAGPLHLTDRLHAVRIALKKFRYAVELAGELRQDPTIAAQLKTLKRNQDLLGRWHDRQVLIDRVRQAQASLTPPSVASWSRLDTIVMGLESDCRRLHGRYLREAAALVAACDRVRSLPSRDLDLQRRRR
jgi:CHAD domain-containing protein